MGALKSRRKSHVTCREFAATYEAVPLFTSLLGAHALFLTPSMQPSMQLSMQLTTLVTAMEKVKVGTERLGRAVLSCLRITV